MADPAERYDLICFSHLRWDAARRAPLSQAARDRRVFFIEEPLFDRGSPHLSMRRSADGVVVVQPTLPVTTPSDEVSPLLRELIDNLVEHFDLDRYVLWFSTPIALPFAHHLQPCGVVYDCPEDADPPSALRPTQLELRLLGAADVVFTASVERCRATLDHHANVHAFPGPALDDAAETWEAMEALVDRAIESRAAFEALSVRRRAPSSAGLQLSM